MKIVEAIGWHASETLTPPPLTSLPSIQVTPSLKWGIKRRKVKSHAVRGYASAMKANLHHHVLYNMSCSAWHMLMDKNSSHGVKSQKRGRSICATLIQLKMFQRKVTKREHAIQDTCFHLQSHMHIFVKVWAKRFDLSDAMTLFLTRTLTAEQTHRGDDGWKTPFCAEKSFAV